MAGMKAGGITDYLDIKNLQRVMDTCSKAFGVALIAVDYHGTPITRRSGFTEHCRMGRENPEFCGLCERCDAFGGIRSAMSSEPCIYRCHAGLVDFAVPIVAGDTYLGAVLAGQVKVIDEPEDGIQNVISGEHDIYSSVELLAARDQIQPIEYDRLVALAEAVRTIVFSVVSGDLAKTTAELDEIVRDKDQELMTLHAQLGDAQRRLRGRMESTRRLEEVFRCFFPVLSELHVLACEEQAKSTDSLLLDFVDVSRYVLETECSLVTLGEETGHAKMLLHLVSTRLPVPIDYAVRCPERFALVPCPFMVLRPIILVALSDPWDATAEEPCRVLVDASEGDRCVEVRVAQNRLGVNAMCQAISGGFEGPDLNFTLVDADRHLRDLGSGTGGLEVTPSASDGGRGCIVSFKLPLSSGE